MAAGLKLLLPSALASAGRMQAAPPPPPVVVPLVEELPLGLEENPAQPGLVPQGEGTLVNATEQQPGFAPAVVEAAGQETLGLAGIQPVEAPGSCDQPTSVLKEAPAETTGSTARVGGSGRPSLRRTSDEHAAAKAEPALPSAPFVILIQAQVPVVAGSAGGALPIPDAEVWVVPLSRDEFLSVVLERDVAADPMDGASIVTHTEEAVEEEDAWSPPSGGRSYGEELERLGEEARAWAASGRSPEREHRLVTHLRTLAGDRYPNVTVLLDQDPKALRDRVTGLLRDSARP